MHKSHNIERRIRTSCHKEQNPPKIVKKMSAISKRRITECVSITKSMFLIIFFLSTIGQLNHQTVEASGVFELELVSLQNIDSVKSSTNQTTNQQQQATNESDLVRIFVCLKEAFTSKLDGPCTFGNASLTLNRDSITQQQDSNTVAATRLPNNQDQNQTTVGSKQTISTQQLQQGSLMTNIVRILFTFRWTKSFTIILTAEQIDADNQQPSSAAANQKHRSAQEQGSRRRGATTTNGTNLVDLSSFNRPVPKDQKTNSNSGKFFDRHVLTENEVLPNLEPNLNKPWSTRFSRSVKSSLVYRFRIYCSLNYYGDGCTTFCRARDDQFGHYNCSSTGQKICLDGWSGPDCDKARCRSGCNQQHGYCDRPDTCQCRPGWTGLRCDECITYPGCQNGYCLSPWQCICQRNWGGVLCDQDLNYCGTHEPCKNNGTCQNIAPGKYKCNCPEGFTGVDCHINLDLLKDTGKMTQLSAGCALNPCLNGGTCFGFNNAASSLKVYGRELKINDSLNASPSKADIGNNEQRSEERIHRCQCAPGWTGDYCQWSDYSPITLLVTNSSQPDSSSSSSSGNDNDNKPNGQNANRTENIITISSETTRHNNEENDGRISPFVASAFMEVSQATTTTTTTLTQPSHLDMKHLISGVVIASVFGVFLALILLLWCCLVAIERNRFPFIQMNIIRSSGDSVESGPHEPIVTSTLKRMHGKIRDSLRLPSTRSSRIKPETKLSIENVLRPPRPPPSYEESSSGNYQHVNRISIEYPIYHHRY